MRKNSGGRNTSVALQHRKVLGSFEKTQAEKLHSNMVNRRAPFVSRHAGEQKTTGVGIALVGSMFVVSYAAVLSAMVEVV